MGRIFDRTFFFFYMPLVANIYLAIGAFFINPGDFHDVIICYVTIFAALSGSAVAFIGFKIHDLRPRRMVLSLVTQSVTLIFIFGGIYRGHGLVFGSSVVSLLNDGQSALYFSVVTWTTLGYGDFSPPPELRLIAALQALLGYLFFGVSVGLGTAVLCERNPSASR